MNPFNRNAALWIVIVLLLALLYALTPVVVTFAAVLLMICRFTPPPSLWFGVMRPALSGWNHSGPR